MRIWLLTSEMPHEFAGGIARYVDNFARTLGAAGHEVVVLYRTQEAGRRQLAPGVEAIGVVPRWERQNESSPGGRPDAQPTYPFNVMGYAAAYSFQMAEEVLELLERLPRPDVIECQEFTALPYYLLQRKLTERTPLNDIPIVVHMHSALFDLLRINQSPRYRFPEYWVGQMEKFCLVAADAILSPSEFLKGEVERTFQRPLGIHTNPYPFIADYACTPSEGKPGEIVYVGRLEWRKGVVGLIEACARLWSAGRDFRLTLIGGDTDFAPTACTVGTLIRRRHQKWIDRGHLKLPGQVPYTEVRSLVREAWAATVPSHWENFPNTCIEAMAAAQVTLVSRQGGQAEMVADDGVNGFIFDWEVPGDLDRQLARVLDLDAQERLAIAERARERIRSLCDPAIVLPQRLAHFEQVMAQHAPRSVFPAVCVEPAAVPASAKARIEAVAGGDGAIERGLLSVVIPFYNLGAYIDETLESVLEATYTPREVVLVDDGSTDEASIAKVAEIEARGLRDVRVVRTENQGLAAARNNGVRAARGEYIAFVDADDTVSAGYFASAVDVLKRYGNVGFVYSWVRFFGESDGIWPAWNAEFPYLLGHNMTCVLSVVRRTAFEAAGGHDPAFAYALEDHAGWVSMLAAGYLGVSLSQPLVNYRIRSQSMLRSTNDSQLLHLHDLLSQTNPEAYRRWGAELYNLQNANGPARYWNHPATEAPVVAVTEEVDGLRHWVHDLEEGKAWLEGQLTAHKETMTAQEGIIAELRSWSADLDEAKRWLEGQVQDAQARAAAAEAELQCERATLNRMRDAYRAWSRQGLVRVLRRTKMLRDLNVD